MKKEVKTVELEVGIEPLVEKVKTIEIVVEEKNVKNVAEYIHFILYHFPKILVTKSKI
jgi:hypothetical protein